jgi:hypothetical protein
MSRKRLLGAVAVAASLALLMGATAQAAGSIKRSTGHALRSPARAISARQALRTNAPTANYLPAGNMKTGVNENGGGAALGTKLYVPGGFTDTANSQLLGVMQTLNANTNKWSKDTELMPAVADLAVQGWADAAVCADSQSKKVYVINGVDGQFLYAATQIYDTTAPLGARWSFGSLPVLANGITTFFSQDSGCAVIQGKVYLFGGYAAIGDPNDPNLQAGLTKATWVYDPGTDTWADTVQPMKKAALWFGYTSNGKSAYAAGGTDNLTTLLPIVNVQTYKPATGWKGLHALSDGLLAPGMGILGTGQQAAVAVFAGGSSDGAGGFLLHQDTVTCAGTCPATGAGFTDANLLLNTHRWFLAYGTSGGKLYAAGGIGVPNGPPEVLRSAEKSA